MMEEVYYWMFGPKILRTLSIVFSYIAIVTWLITLITGMILIIKQHGEWDIFQAIITAYTLLIQFPQLLPSIYIIFKEALVDDIEVARHFYK